MTILPLTAPSDLRSPIIRVSDVRQWAYCPRVAWWTHVCPVGKVESFKMRQGLAKERRLQRLQRRRTLRKFRLGPGRVDCKINMYSEQLGLTGRLDMLIEWRERRYPVEIKFTAGPPRLNHRLQLAGYALLLEDNYGLPVSHGYVVRLPDDTVDKVPIDTPLRELTWRTVQALRTMMLREQMPPRTPLLARCQDCEYARFCGDVE